MDIGSIVGLIIALALMLLGMGQYLSAFVDFPSLMIVVGGTLGATMVFFPLDNLLGMGGIIKKIFFSQSQSPSGLVATIIDFAGRARREGILSLQNASNETDDEFLTKGINLVVDGIEEGLILEIMNNEIDNLEERHKNGAEMLASMGALSPAFGMIGTLIGLVIMLQNLQDTAAIGPAMAIALITTFYGAVLANLVFIPFSGKLKVRSNQELLLRRLTVAGVMGIAAGNNPRVVEQKLNAFLAPKHRGSLTG
ncbi:MAG: MotA/TolQ/ExbB proton channel family protein [Deltaproteobacteria bacterium]|nr:MotA/TolQ/ExbB proton channel family protein [Deltaproteobacteria bacterium]